MSPELHTLVGPYVLDALDDEERRLFEEHLVRCPTCRSDVAELGAVPTSLARSVAEPVPGPLRDRVLAEVDATRQDRPRVRAPRSLRLGRLAVAAAAATVLVALAVAVTSWQGADERAREAEAVLAVVSAADSRRHRLEGDIGRLEAISSSDRGETVVLGQGVPDLPDGRTYELWLIGEDGPVPAGTFRPDGGRVRHRVEGVAAVGLGITEEPEGGSDQPTGPILASAEAGEP